MSVNCAASERLYAEYYGKVKRYVESKVSNRQDAEDVVSDVFVKVCKNYGGFDASKASESTWIYTIARNTVVDYYRRRHIFSEIPDTLSDGSSIDEMMIDKENLQRLAEGLSILDERSRDVIILRYYSGEMLKNIAEMMGISYVYAKVLHKSAIDKLRRFMEIPSES